jgi:PTH2 family peptidyl-tRNA hydrolase
MFHWHHITNKYTADCETIMKNDNILRLYSLVREDLGMTEGKKVAQAGHAYLGAFINADPSIQKAYHSEFPAHPGTKVCLAAKNLHHLLRAKEEAEAAGIPTYLVTDSGCKNFFNGEPTVTALGLGPASKDQIKHITKRFQLI